MKRTSTKQLYLLLLPFLALLLFSGASALPARAGTCPLQAYPETPLAAILFSTTAGSVPQPDPAHIQVEAGASAGITITPTITTAAADVGSNGYLIMYLYFPDSNFGFSLPGKSVNLASSQLVDLFPQPLNFSDYPGLRFLVYYGYVNNTGAIYYNVYTVTVIPCASPGDSPCAGLDQASCEQAADCAWIWKTFSTGTCAVDCSRFTDEQSCRAAFNSSGCQWISNFIAATCTSK